MARVLGSVTVAAVVLAIASTSHGQSPLTRAQNALIDGRLADQFQMTRERALEDAEKRYQFLDGGNTGGGAFEGMAHAAARRHQIPTGLFAKLVKTESAWRPRAVSRAGAIGLAQLMPETARRLGVDPWDPRQNLEGGARYLRQQYRRFGTWRLALAAYNAGPEAVVKYGGVPPYAETRAYVKKILGN